MHNIIYKEFKLSASLITYLFILFTSMFFLPGYPILCGSFFITLGIFKSFENAIVTNDIVFSALLPISKKDVVKGKFIFVCTIELISILLMTIIVVIRNTLLLDCLAYTNNALMNANFFALASALVIFSMFNLIFVYGFFKTTYNKTKPFVFYMIVSFLIILISEALHYFPNLYYLNAFGKDYLSLQLISLFVGIFIYILVTIRAYKKSCHAFEKVDL